MLVRVDVVIRTIDQLDLEIHQRIARDGPRLRSLDNAFLNRRPELMGHCATKNLVLKNKASTSRQGFKDHLAVAKLTAAAGLFLVTALYFGALRDGFFVWNLRRMQGYLHAVTLLQFILHPLDAKFSGTVKQEFVLLRTTREMNPGILFQDFL